MTKKELTTIQKKIEQYKTWAEEEFDMYKKTEEEEAEEHFMQYLQNNQAADVLKNLLSELNY